MQNNLQPEIATNRRAFLFILSSQPVRKPRPHAYSSAYFHVRNLRQLYLNRVSGLSRSAAQALGVSASRQGPSILEVEICGVTNQTKAVFDATASTFDADRSRLIPGRDTFYRWAIDLILEGALFVARRSLRFSGGPVGLAPRSLFCGCRLLV
jgi:hypothetical protein